MSVTRADLLAAAGLIGATFAMRGTADAQAQNPPVSYSGQQLEKATKDILDVIEAAVKSSNMRATAAYQNIPQKWVPAPSPFADDPALHTASNKLQSGPYFRFEERQWKRPVDAKPAAAATERPSIDKHFSFASGRIDKQFDAPNPYDGIALDQNPSRVAAAIIKRTGLRRALFELALGQASESLERALAARLQYAELYFRSFTTAVELGQFSDLDDVHRRETLQGFYEVDAAVSHANQAAELAFINEFSNLVMLSGNNFSNFYDEAHIAAIIGSEQDSAYLAHAVGFVTSAKNAGAPIPTFLGDTNGSGGAPSLNFLDASVAVAKSLAEYRYSLEVSQAAFGVTSESASVQASSARIVGLLARATWDDVNRTFRQERTSIARKYQAEKLKAFTEPGGAYNAAELLDGLHARFRSDFRHAVARLYVAADAMKAYFNYAHPLPDFAKDAAADRAVLWARNATNFLIRRAQSDVTLVAPVSIFVANSANFFVQLEGGKGAWDFNVTEDMFGGSTQTQIRLLGLQLYVDKGALKRDSLFFASVRVPQRADYRPKGSTTMTTIDQSSTPVLPVGRILGRDSQRTADIVGTTTLKNLSPLGTWRVVIDDTRIPNINTNVRSRQDGSAHIADVYVDMHVIVTPT